MENTCVNIRRGNYKGFRQGPQIELWIWCIVIKSLITFPVVFSRCHGVDISVSLYPEGAIKVLYGEPLEIFCKTDRDTAYDLEFRQGSYSIESEVVNSTTRRLYIEHLDKQISSYYCLNKVNHKMCVTRVLVDKPPLDVNDFSCISKNLEEMNCTWTSREKIISPRNYTLIFDNQRPLHCAVKVMKRWFCLWNTTSQPRYRQRQDRFDIQLIGCNYFGCNRQTFIINHFAFVKPDPPQSLRLIGNNAKSVLLRWRIPINVFDFLPCPVVHRIEYKIAEMDNYHSVDATALPPKNYTYTFLLSNLPYAHMFYEVRISIKSALDIEGNFWSDFAFITFITASERPQRPPKTTVGAFEQSVFENKRIINVYWQQLSEYEEAGDNFTYSVMIKQDSQNPETLQPKKEKSLSYITLKDASLDAIDIFIQSTNANGSSTNSSSLYIPSKRDTDGLKVSSFTKLAYENGTYKLSWVPIQNTDNYTLFWCQQDVPRICVGRMNFTVLDSSKNTCVINLPRDNRYQFAISANKGSKTSGMTWASCEMSEDGIPMYNLPVKLEHGVPGKSFVKIMWTMSCIVHDYVTGYLIRFCPVLNTSNVCDNSFENKSVIYINDPKQMETNITNLKPSTTYLFSLALNTTYGLKSIENLVTVVTTTEDV